jgi:hypothetical protein
MPVLAKKIQDFKPQPDPNEEKLKQLQTQLLEAQLKNEMSQSEENMADKANKMAQAVLNQAKADTEKAKARALHSTSDNEDLKFLQEQDGVKHQQDLALEDKRLENDLERKGADSLLDPNTPREEQMTPGVDDLMSADEIGQLPANPGQEEIPVINTPEENLDSQLTEGL